MLVVRSELGCLFIQRGRCCIHWYNWSGYTYWFTKTQELHNRKRRGTLQEELNNDIAPEIMKATGSVGVYVPSNTWLL